MWPGQGKQWGMSEVTGLWSLIKGGYGWRWIMVKTLDRIVPAPSPWHWSVCRTAFKAPRVLAEDRLVIPALPCTTAPNRLTFEKSEILLAVSKTARFMLHSGNVWHLYHMLSNSLHQHTARKRYSWKCLSKRLTSLQAKGHSHILLSQFDVVHACQRFTSEY